MVDVDKNALRKTSFRDYEYFKDVDRVYLDFFQKLRAGIDNIVPCKPKRVKGNSQNWFDGEVLEKRRSRDKLFKAFKKRKLRIDKESNKKGKYDALKLIAAKKRSKTYWQTKELWNTLKSIGMPKKTVALYHKKPVTYDIKTMSKVFKDSISNLAESLLGKLPDPQFFEILIFSQDVWGNVHYVPEINLIF